MPITSSPGSPKPSSTASTNVSRSTASAMARRTSTSSKGATEVFMTRDIPCDTALPPRRICTASASAVVASTGSTLRAKSSEPSTTAFSLAAASSITLISIRSTVGAPSQWSS